MNSSDTFLNVAEASITDASGVFFFEGSPVYAIAILFAALLAALCNAFAVKLSDDLMVVGVTAEIACWRMNASLSKTFPYGAFCASV